MPVFNDLAANSGFHNLDLFAKSKYNPATLSYDIASEKLTYAELVTQLDIDVSTIYSKDGSLLAPRTVTLSPTNTLGFSGGKTTFTGEDSTSTKFSFVAQDSVLSRSHSFSNSGVFYTGHTDETDYFRHEIQRAVVYSDSGSAIGFIADRGGNKIGLRAGTTNQYVQYTGAFKLTKWSGAETGAGIVDTIMHVNGANVYWGNDSGVGIANLKVHMQRLGSLAFTVSAATQTNSAANVWNNGLWNGANSDSQSFELLAKASSTTNLESIWQLSHEGTDIFGVRNDGVTILTSFTVATLPAVVAKGVIIVSDETGGYTMAFSDGINWMRVTDNTIVS